MLVLAITVLLAWLYLALLHGRFWLTADKRLPSAAPHAFPRIAIIVPARNEADVIARAISSLLAQTYAGEFHIFLVDDNSDDGTAAAARGVARANRVTVIPGEPPPPGWTGKVWAMQQGWQAAQSFNPESVWLTDADIVHPPDALTRLVAKADGRLDMVSLMVRLHCAGFAEQLMIPAFVYFFFMLYPPQWIADDGMSDAGAAGGCILIQAQTLRDAAAFESLRGEVIDDCALARRIKDIGGRLWLGLADESTSIRSYGGIAGIIRMIARTAFSQLRHSFWLLLVSVLGLAWLFFAPIGLLFTRDLMVQCCAALACVVMLITYRPMCNHYRVGWWMVFTLPIAAAIYLYATVLSAIRYWSGHGGAWKGRAQDQRPA